MNQHVLIVRYSEPENATHVYGPYDDARDAEADWAYRISLDFLNEGEMPDDVEYEIVALTPLPPVN